MKIVRNTNPSRSQKVDKDISISFIKIFGFMLIAISMFIVGMITFGPVVIVLGIIAYVGWIFWYFVLEPIFSYYFKVE